MDNKAESTHNKPDESTHNKRKSDQSHESDDQHQNKKAKTNESFDMLRNTDSSETRLIYDVTKDTARHPASRETRPDRDTEHIQRAKILGLAGQRLLLEEKSRQLTENDQMIRSEATKLRTLREDINTRTSALNTKFEKLTADNEDLRVARARIDTLEEPLLARAEQHIHGDAQASFEESTRTTGRSIDPTPFTRVEQELNQRARFVEEANGLYETLARNHAREGVAAEDDEAKIKHDNEIYSQKNEKHQEAENDHKNAIRAYEEEKTSYLGDLNRFIMEK